MGDRIDVHELKRWATEEFNLPAKSLPNDSYIKSLCAGHGASTWKYITQHVYQQRNVRVMRGNIQWYKMLEDKELQQVQGQSDAARRRELQQQIQDLREKLNHLDSEISAEHSQRANQEQLAERSWASVEDNQKRELMLRAFAQRCAEERQALATDTRKIGGHCQALKQLAKKAEVEVVFGDESSRSSCEDDLTWAAPEPQVQREVRRLCEERVLFFQSLQDSELRIVRPGTTHMTREERMVAFQHWLSSVEDVLGAYPPRQLLSTLQHLALLQEKAMGDKMAAVDVAQDVHALRFNYDRNHLLDISRQEEEELPPVKTLLEEAWAEVQSSLLELSQTRGRTQALHTQICRELDSNPAGGVSQSGSMLQCAWPAELQSVVRAAVRDSVQEQCQQMKRTTRDKQEAVRNLRCQWNSILEFRQLVDTRQEHIRELIKLNSTAKTELIRQHKKNDQFLHTTLAPQFGEVITTANGLRNSISQETQQFSAVSLSALDCRVVEGEQRIPVAQLSIHRLYASSSSHHTLCETLGFPLYKAPEELGLQVLSQHLELRVLRHLLQLHSSSLEIVQNQTALLPAPDQQALLSRVAEEDQQLLQSLLPRLRQITQRCSTGLDYSQQVKTALSHWWDQPAQTALPEMCLEGLTLRQWIQRWKLAANAP